jgi:hypothetical protein
MKIISEKWKIFQTDEFEYILLFNGKNSQKIKGKNSTGIVDVLNELQISDSFQKAEIELKKKFDVEFINNVIEWLEFNHFIKHENDNVVKNINLVGEFSEDEKLLSDFIANLPTGIIVNNYINLSKTKKIELIKGQTTLLIAPFWYNEKNIIKISELMVNSKDDFFYIELYGNGLTIGPLLNSSKGTACLNCIEKRKLFNSSNPTLIVENIINKEIINENIVNVFEIGHYSFNKTFIYNELVKILLNNNKSLYNKSLFMDFNKYENHEFKVIKTPNCRVCNPQTIFNPL